MVASLAVYKTLKLPQAPVVALPHVTVQSTPALEESPVTVALMVEVLVSANDAAGARVIVMEITGVVLIVAVAVPLVPSLAEVAMIVTGPPAGGVAGAVYVVVPRLTVVVGLKLPQPLTGRQLQVTPRFLISLATVPIRCCVPDA